MASQGCQQPDIRNILLVIILATLVLVLPGVHWSFFGWLYMLLPLFSFFLFGRFGIYLGKKVLLTAVIISLIAHLLLGGFDLFLFSSAMLLPGFVLYYSMQKGDTPSVSGLKGCLSLAGGWLIAGVIASTGTDVSSYSQMLHSFDEALTETVTLYRQSGDISAETLAMIEATISQMKIIIPAIMPGIIGSIVLLVIWMTMVLGNVLLAATIKTLPAWPSFSKWSLPDKLIWALIAMGVIILVPVDPLPKLGINCVLLLIIIYCFQGLSIAVFFMNKWKVPILIRSFFYVIIVFQSLGTLVLLLFGIADIWFDFRKLKTNTAADK